ncbi:acyl-CoA dehydrogenase family protein [Actinomycetospora soli]|uniref:acyl-CoA dehydrogenase family protein n=1 Tax=Actinomycetospora soli TaxID=2893887 RepID=UPI001E32B3A0|nr:acyl-CoA dehydrogenase family protein [Actinomycetospora soli]MCD2191020.1 acyl-CoA dehydrogenase family protein [Actinomycetospora soli]
MTEQLTRPGLHVGDEFDAIVARLEALDPLLRAEADAVEAAGRLTPRVVEALEDARAFDIGMPAELGGPEFTPRQLIRAVETLSRADASTGWVVMALQMIAGTTVAYLGADTVADMLDGSHRMLAAGQGTRPGRARQAPGGYRVSGSWQFASGLLHCTHVHTAAIVEETGEALVFTLPREQATLVENWDVMGLRGTGSIDYTLDDVFVPAGRTYVATTTEPLVGGAVYRCGLANMAGICHAGWALGVGRRLLDEMAALAAAKSGTYRAGVDTSEFHAAYARAEATLRAARAWTTEVWADNEATLATGSALSTDQETLTRLALASTTEAALEVGQTVYRWAGTAALRSGPLNRVFRDLHGGTQHVTSSPAVVQGAGKRLAGLAPDARWVFLELVE